MDTVRKESESIWGIKIKKSLKKIPSETYYSSCDRIYFCCHLSWSGSFSVCRSYKERITSVNFQTRTTKTRVIKSTRGNIYDRNGTVVASNVLAYSVTFEDSGTYNSTREKNLTLNGIAYQVLQIRFPKTGDSLSDNFHITVNDHGDYALM